jgi:hypothetical protein
MTIRRTSRSAFAILLWMVPLAAIRAAEPQPVEAALARPAIFQFAKAPLPDVMAALSRSHGIPILADRRALQTAGIRPSEIAITAMAKSKPLGTALDSLLRPHKLAWIVWHDVVLVTTASAAQEKYQETHVYKLTRRVPLQRRIATITQTVASESWANVGGPGDAAPLPPGLLVIRQSPLVHQQIAEKFANSLAPVRARQAVEPAEGSEIEKKLESPSLIDFDNVPLTGALKSLRELHAVKITLDEAALKEAEIRGEKLLVTARIGKGIRLASGLSLLLEQADPKLANTKLAWTADDAGITITTHEAAKAKPIRRTYKVSDLLPDGELEPLIEAIQTTVSPADWEEVGGEGTIKPGTERGTLDVSQSYPIHRQLRQLFADLRAALEKK